MDKGSDSKNCLNNTTKNAFAPAASHSGVKKPPMPRLCMFIKSGTRLIVAGISSENITSLLTMV
jgi:hypothetical protein